MVRVDASRRISWKKVTTLPRVRAFDHANPWRGCAGRIKVATLPRVRAFDHANPWSEGLRVTPKTCNFASAALRARPRQSMSIRVAALNAEKLVKLPALPRIRAFPRQSNRP